jgi:5-methylcytosine-specific restriction endonuclease McrA
VRKKHRKFKGGKRKLLRKYFKGVQRRKGYYNAWTFYGTILQKEILIADIQEILVNRYNYLKFEEWINPYNPEAYEKFDTQNRKAIVKDIRYNKEKRRLLVKQSGKCPYCNGWIDGSESVEIDHIIAKADGGTDKKSNLRLIHKECHDRKTVMERRIRAVKRKIERAKKKKVK